MDSMVNQTWLERDQVHAFGSARYAPSRDVVGSFLGPFLTVNGKSASDLHAGIFIRSEEVTALLLNQSLEFLQMSMANLVAHHFLVNAGLDTWARVTNYYASYFSIHSLLNIQGRSISRITLGSETPVFLMALDLTSHEYAVTSKFLGKNPYHKTPWTQFYSIYDRYATPHGAFELVTKRAHITDPTDESIERNSINYRPFAGFEEVRSLAFFGEKKSSFLEYERLLLEADSLDEALLSLQAYSTDADCRFFARTLLKILLVGNRIQLCARSNTGLESELVLRKSRWREFLDNVNLGGEENYVSKVLFFGGMLSS